MYRQISLSERFKMEVLIDKEYGVPEIAKTLGYNRSTIYRELKHGTNHLAQRYYSKRHANRGSYLIKEHVKQQIDYLLSEYQWSPEQIIQT